MSYRLGIDVGGTFTDFVLVDDEAASRRQNAFHAANPAGGDRARAAWSSPRRSTAR